MSAEDEHNLGMIAHLLGFAGFLIPFGNLLGPFVIWLIKGKESEFINDQAKEALNFQIR